MRARSVLILVIVLAGFTVAGCGDSGSHQNSDLAPVRARGSRLTAGGNPFFAFGFNYGGRRKSSWPYEFDERGSRRLHRYLAGMERAHQLGANTLRIYLQLFSFIKRSDGHIQARPRALSHLKQVLAKARRLRLRLDVTGNLVWVPGASPKWYDRLPARRRWQVQARFWSIVSRATARSPAVLCYELTSEPTIGTHAKRWYSGRLGGLDFVQLIARKARPGNRAHLAKEWIRTLKSAIRSHDRTHLIGLGLQRLTGKAFAPQNIAPLLDVLLLHLYPRTGHIAQAEHVIHRFAAPGKPLILGETFMLRSNAATQKRFLLDSRPYLSGILTFLGPRQGKGSGLRAALHRANLHQFRSLRGRLIRSG